MNQDQVNGMLMLDQEMKDAALRLAPSLGVVDAGAIRRTSSNCILPKPCLATISNFLSSNV